MYQSNITKEELNDMNQSIMGLIARKSSIVQIDELEGVFPLLSNDILTNERIKDLKRRYSGKKNPKLKDIRILNIVDNMIIDNTYFLISNGYTTKGNRVSRKKTTSGGVIETTMLKFNLVTFLYPMIYESKGKLFKLDEFMSNYTHEEFYAMNLLLANYLSDSISNSESNKLFELLGKSRVIQEYIWDIEKYHSQIKMYMGGVYTYPNPWGLDALKGEVFELGNFKNFTKEIFKSLLILPYFNYIKNIMKYSADKLVYKAHIRSIDNFKMIVEIDDGLELDTSLILPSGVEVSPIIEKVSDVNAK